MMALTLDVLFTYAMIQLGYCIGRRQGRAEARRRIAVLEVMRELHPQEYQRIFTSVIEDEKRG